MMSLRDGLSDSDWVGSMNLLFKSENYAGKILLVLEGKTDIGVFRSIAGSSLIHYDSPCKGKLSVIESVSKLREYGNDKVYGICDADFDVIMNTKYENIHLTDYHDVEIMMLCSNFVEQFFYEYTDSKCYKNHEAGNIINKIENGIYDICYGMGILKWINAEHQLGLNFNGLDYPRFITVENFDVSFNKEEYIDNVLERYKKELSRDYLVELYLEYEMKNEDKLHICNGHDFTYMLSFIYKNNITTDKNISQERVEKTLRVFYSKDCFEKTKLYKNIQKIIESHGSDLQMVS